MNQRRVISLLFCTAMFFIISCGGGGSSEEKSTTDTTATKTDTTTATTPAPQPQPSAVSTTPQDVMIVTHKVKDFAKWKMVYDGDDSNRLASGVHSFVIGRSVPDSNTVIVTTKIDDQQKAKAFGNSPSLKKAMQKGGVVGAPTMRMATIVYLDLSTISTDLRVRTDIKVKDWDKWKKAFDSTRALNEDIGLKLRAYGHDIADNHKVMIVSAVTDTAKARAYFKGDVSKQRRMASGVVGEPQRSMYRVVQIYQ
jgi:heme-degrading monooxygenase HmoA